LVDNTRDVLTWYRYWHVSNHATVCSEKTRRSIAPTTTRILKKMVAYIWKSQKRIIRIR